MHRHHRYYLYDGTITLNVENVIFKVHRYLLERDSDFLRDKFRDVHQTEDGLSDETAFHLSDVTLVEFETLLDFFYNGMYVDSRPKSLAEWTALLSIASTLKFSRIRQVAIHEIDTGGVDPVAKVVLAVKYDIPAWLKPAYEAICQRDDPLEIWEAEKLGLRTAVLLAKAREALGSNHKLKDALLTPLSPNPESPPIIIGPPHVFGPRTPQTVSPPSPMGTGLFGPCTPQGGLREIPSCDNPITQREAPTVHSTPGFFSGSPHITLQSPPWFPDYCIDPNSIDKLPPSDVVTDRNRSRRTGTHGSRHGWGKHRIGDRPAHEKEESIVSRIVQQIFWSPFHDDT